MRLSKSKKTRADLFLVEKIGGSSMSQFDLVLENILLKKLDRFYPKALKALHPYGRCYVVSAYGGVTDMLLESKNGNKPGIYHDFLNSKRFEKKMKSVLNMLLSINKKFEPLGLELDKANDFIHTRIEESIRVLNDLHRVMASGYLLMTNIRLAARELLASIGESHSAYNTCAILNRRGVATDLFDLGGFQDDRQLHIDQRIHEAVGKMRLSKRVAVVTGYVKGIDGIMREFDRGYSEITFSKIAERLRPHEAIIHKEFHLSSADPKIVGEKKAVAVGNTNYDVADQLADVGMEAIHPRASKPLEAKGILLRVRNTFEPEHRGTLISPDYIGKAAKIEIITGSDKVVLLEVHDPQMVGSSGFDAKLSTTVANYGISYIFKSTNANSISQLFWQKDLHQDMIKELEGIYHTVSVLEVAIVCVIGSNIAIPGMLARSASVLSKSKINIKCFSQSLRQVNMQFVIDRKSYRKAIRALHQEFCE